MIKSLSQKDSIILYGGLMNSNPVGAVDAFELYRNVNIPGGVAQAISVIQTFVQKVHKAAQEIFNKIRDIVVVTALRLYITAINQTGTDVEKIFNILNSMPFFALLFGPLRVVAGKIQTLTGALLAGLGELGAFIGRQTGAPPELMHKWNTISKLGLEHIIHGSLNVLRGSGESLIAGYTMGLANMLLFVPNLSNNRNFAPYFTYGTLVDPLIARPSFAPAPTPTQTVPIAVVVDSSASPKVEVSRPANSAMR